MRRPVLFGTPRHRTRVAAYSFRRRFRGPHACASRGPLAACVAWAAIRGLNAWPVPLPPPPVPAGARRNKQHPGGAKLHAAARVASGAGDGPVLFSGPGVHPWRGGVRDGDWPRCILCRFLIRSTGLRSRRPGSALQGRGQRVAASDVRCSPEENQRVIGAFASLVGFSIRFTTAGLGVLPTGGLHASFVNVPCYTPTACGKWCVG